MFYAYLAECFCGLLCGVGGINLIEDYPLIGIAISLLGFILMVHSGIHIIIG